MGKLVMDISMRCIDCKMHGAHMQPHNLIRGGGLPTSATSAECVAVAPVVDLLAAKIRCCQNVAMLGRLPAMDEL